tara:strand:+ start:187 stop:936 length:750 start_codon:yes stop_codon:yes gene_type:complete
MKNLLEASALELVNQHINLDKVLTLTTDIGKGAKTTFDKQIELSLIMHKGFEWFKSPDAKQVMKALNIEMTTEDFHTKVFGFKKSFFYDMVKVGSIRANETDVVSKYKKECNKLEKDGESSGRSIKGLINFAKATDKAEEEAEETGEEAEAVEVEAKLKTIMTFAIKGELTNDGKGASIKLMEDGEIKVTGSSDAILDSIHEAFEQMAKNLTPKDDDDDVVSINDIIEDVNEAYKEDNKIEVYVLEEED